MKSISILVFASIALLMVGCAKQEATVAPSAASQAAPAPKNLSPAERAAYEAAVKNAGPSATPPPPSGQ